MADPTYADHPRKKKNMNYNQIIREIELQAEMYVASKPQMSFEQVETVNDYTEYLVGMLGIMAEAVGGEENE